MDLFQQEAQEIGLRTHQVKAVDMIKRALSSRDIEGRKVRRVILGACTSFGKTVTAAHILKSTAENGKKAMFIADRVKLINQTIAAMDRYGIDCGVQQAQHERCRPWAPVQIASVQTLMRRTRLPDADVYIIDECQTHFAYITELMERLDNCIFIGLSATPYSKSLGKYYQDLVVPITPRELLDDGYLCPVDYYIGHSVDTSKVKNKRLGTGGQDFNPKDLEKATESDKILNGDIIKNWVKHGENSQTIAFSPSITQSKWLVAQLNDYGIKAEHIDCYTDPEERELIYAAHNRGEFKVLSCSQLLNTGYDSPTTRCIIDCYPTQSLITYVQRVGRIMRTADNKPNAIYLDHAGNWERFGRAEDIVPDHLDDGEKEYNEASLTKDDKPEAKEKSCPQCYQLFKGMRCACGYEIPAKEVLEHDGTELVKLSDLSPAERRGLETPQADKDLFLAGLRLHMEQKDYAYGWVKHTYADKYGSYPENNNHVVVTEIPADVKKFITAQNIRRAKGKKHYAKSGGR